MRASPGAGHAPGTSLKSPCAACATPQTPGVAPASIVPQACAAVSPLGIGAAMETCMYIGTGAILIIILLVIFLR